MAAATGHMSALYKDGVFYDQEARQYGMTATRWEAELTGLGGTEVRLVARGLSLERDVLLAGPLLLLGSVQAALSSRARMRSRVPRSDITPPSLRPRGPRTAARPSGRNAGPTRPNDPPSPLQQASQRPMDALAHQTTFFNEFPDDFKDNDLE